MDPALLYDDGAALKLAEHEFRSVSRGCRNRPVGYLLKGDGTGLLQVVGKGSQIEFLQPGGSTSSRAAATAVELQFAL
jgi:hypothetical protein